MLNIELFESIKEKIILRGTQANHVLFIQYCYSGLYIKIYPNGYHHLHDSKYLIILSNINQFQFLKNEASEPLTIREILLKWYNLI